ncbi:hypothetical protein KC319_g18978, partial [Hortaea werneckii]
MGNTASTPSPASPVRHVSRRQRPVSPRLTLDEKFDAFHIDHEEHATSQKVLSPDDSQHVSAAETEA